VCPRAPPPEIRLPRTNFTERAPASSLARWAALLRLLAPRFVAVRVKISKTQLCLKFKSPLSPTHPAPIRRLLWAAAVSGRPLRELPVPRARLARVLGTLTGETRPAQGSGDCS